MSQVTRCPSCGTRFKVVADQLRISQGWVRCGMCKGVFDASKDLQAVSDDWLQAEMAAQEQARQQTLSESPGTDASAVLQQSVAVVPNAPVSGAFSTGPEKTDTGSGLNSEPKPASDPVAPAVQTVPTNEAAQAVAGLPASEPSFVEQARSWLKTEQPAAKQDVLLDVIPAQDKVPAEDKHKAVPVEPVLAPKAASTQDDAAALELGQDSQNEVHVELDTVEVRRPDHPAGSHQSAGHSPADSNAGKDKAEASGFDEPSFVRQARRKAFWHSAGMRVTLVLGALVAVAGGAGQYVWQQRDTLAAKYPELAPVLAQACSLTGCELQARREIADVVISGSGFKQLADAHQYQWSLTLENRSDVPVAIPMAELTLTDSDDKPLLRRVIDLRLLGAPKQLRAREEWSVNVPVQLQDLGAAVAGYRALVFYP